MDQIINVLLAIDSDPVEQRAIVYVSGLGFTDSMPIWRVLAYQSQP